MKKITLAMGLFCVLPAAWAANDALYADFKAMMDSSFQSNGIAAKHRMYQLDFQKACSGEKDPPKKEMQAIEAAQLKTIRYPADGKYLGDWKEGEKIAISGRGLTWTDKTRFDNGGGCYNCHQLSHHEISYGTIGPSLLEYGKVRGSSDEIIKYTWGKIYNAKAYNACSNMPRNGDAEILTEQQMKHLMAYLFDPASPVNKK
ncbi:MAG: sulfur oxidation c-type cytochrome SoxX [Betaproteobacteria bacterium]|jgi:sulfur-oxidizing protein SoxX